MNLKVAALVLGVHYQTAYKWVRSGALTAVRIGGRYDISDAAIKQFQAHRRSIVADVAITGAEQPFTGATQEDVIEELEAMVLAPILSSVSAVNFAARRGSTVLGDLCAITLLQPDGRLGYGVVEHAEPDRAAFIGAIARSMSMAPSMGTNAVMVPLATGTGLRIPHVSQDELRAAIRPELHQHLPAYSIHSLIAIPIMARGKTLGVMMFTRDTPGHPYTLADEQFAARMGTRLGWLIQTAHEIQRAWKLRRELAAALRGQIIRYGEHRPDAVELDQLLRAPGDEPELPAAVYDPDGRFIATNQAFQNISGFTATELSGLNYLETTHPDDRSTERTNFERLTSGEIDYLDIHAHRVLADGSILLCASHRVAVRDPGATLECIITVARPLPMTHGPSQR